MPSYCRLLEIARRYIARTLFSLALFLSLALRCPFLQITDTLEYTLVDINTRECVMEM